MEWGVRTENNTRLRGLTLHELDIIEVAHDGADLGERVGDASRAFPAADERRDGVLRVRPRELAQDLPADVAGRAGPRRILC